MRGVKKVLAGAVSLGTMLYWSAAPALAIGLCPEKPAGQNAGGDFSGLCNQKWDVNTIVSTGINVLLFVAFVAALGFLIYGGIRWIISGGDKEGTQKAKSTVTSALIGLIIVLASWILLNVVIRFFGLGDIKTFTLPQLPQ